MILNIERDKEYADKVQSVSIHGKYPYKTYLEILGNSIIGRYIVIVSNKQIKKDSIIDEISVKLSDNKFRKRNTNSNIVKPNTAVDGYFVRYKVKEINILDIGETPIFVYRSTREK